VVVDAYQGAGVVPIDVNQLDCDYLIAGTLKYLLGSPGLAFLWVRPGLAHNENPALTGWFARTNPFAFTPQVLDYADGARRFQTGTPAIPAVYAAAAGLALINETDTTEVFQHVSALADILQTSVVEKGYTLYSPASAAFRGPQVAILVGDPEHLTAFLQNHRIFVSPRGHAIRMSLHFYNNQDDVARITEALAQYLHRHPEKALLPSPAGARPG
jgi:selenocysteine lyase/cysteine desulfurase